MSILAEFASGATLDAAFDWLGRRRKRYLASADIRDFRSGWPDEKRRIQSDLL